MIALRVSSGQISGLPRTMKSVGAFHDYMRRESYKFVVAFVKSERITSIDRIKLAGVIRYEEQWESSGGLLVSIKITVRKERDYEDDSDIYEDNELW